MVHIHDWMVFLTVMIALGILSPLIGFHLASLIEGKRTLLHPLLGWLEKGLYRLCGVDEMAEMTWKTYAKGITGATCLGILFLFVLQMVQGFLPFNPQKMGAPDWPLALNTAVSFATNTNWQAYSGETTMSYAVQMFGLTSQNFLSPAIGLAVLMAFMRGIARKTTVLIGNCWVDLTRSILYLLLPLSVAFSLGLISLGTIQTLAPSQKIETLEGHKQEIPLGPVASQEAIKLLGTNGGGFFNANSAHPFENPTPLTNVLGLIALFLLPAASVFAYGKIVGSKRHGILLLAIMTLLFLAGLVGAVYAETRVNPFLEASPILEGKEVRFGVDSSAMWAVMTTDTSNGSVNAMHDSLSPIAGGVALFNLQVGEMIFGGVGVGLCSMLIFVLLTVFLGGLMVGRTPEYFGKKIETREIQWVTLGVLAPCVLILIGSMVVVLNREVISHLVNKGPHGLTEILYALSSTSMNNGSAFGGLDVNNLFFNLLLSVVMFLGRFVVLIPSLAIAGYLAVKRTTVVSVGTFSTQSLLFAVLLTGVILMVGALTFFPALSLGPILEHLLMVRGKG